MDALEEDVYDIYGDLPQFELGQEFEKVCLFPWKSVATKDL